MSLSIFTDPRMLLGTCLAAAAAGYACFATYAVLRRGGAASRFRKWKNAGAAPAPVSVLKPLCGDEPGLYENLRGFFTQSHPDYQLLFGVRDPEDQAIGVVRRLLSEFPEVDAELVVDGRVHGANLKVSNLINLLPRARHDCLVLADSDIGVAEDYLTRVIAPLSDPGVGLVTCLYRGVPRAGFWSRLGALFIDDWFAASVHVSRALGSSRFAFGATIALRKETLEAAGGFDALSDVLADDFWLGEFVRMQGLRTVLSEVVVDTDVTEATLPALWSHELRWLRTIRAVEPTGFALTFVTFTFPVLAAGLALAPTGLCVGIAAVGIAARVALHAAQRQARLVPAPAYEAALLPLRDALLFVEWTAALAGFQVSWRNQILDAAAGGRRLRLLKRLFAVSSGRGLIITADDFGLHQAVNEAVELAHRDGILTTASLMVGGPAAADAVERARRMPNLRVGLHLVLADGAAVLPRERIPDLVDGEGRFGSRMVRDGFRFFFLPSVRRQLEAEIRAQFEAFAATGLPLDHVNAHKHFHLHPTILSLVLKIGREYGLEAVRLPAEAGAPVPLRPWLWLLARRLDAAGVSYNHSVVGIEDSGAMDEPALLRALRRLPRGITEVYFHPATVSGAAIAPSMPDYRHADELAALRSPRVRDEVRSLGVPLGGFSDLFGPDGRSALGATVRPRAAVQARGEDDLPIAATGEVKANDCAA
jgi:ceramide glucosyltransferase